MTPGSLGDKVKVSIIQQFVVSYLNVLLIVSLTQLGALPQEHPSDFRSKSGDRPVTPSNYRPIIQLITDYLLQLAH